MEPYIRTYTGKRFFPLDPRPEMFDIIDVAHALSVAPRWTGHTLYHYSVALHSLHVVSMVTAKHELAALLHDLSEAYLCDIAKPIKPMIQGYQEIEARLMSAAAQAFGFEWPLSREVKHADAAALWLEAQHFFPATAEEDVEKVLPVIQTDGWNYFRNLHPFDAREKFLEQYTIIKGKQVKYELHRYV